MMDCAGYGPCSVPGFSQPQMVQYTWYEASQCEAVTPQVVLDRLCGRMSTDEPLYQAARTTFDQRVRTAGAPLASRVKLLNKAGADLAAHSEAQSALDQSALALSVGVQLSRAYRIRSGGGAAWVVDELASWYKPFERARMSCVNCSGDVVPEFDLIGCWPLWAQFGPDELRFRCTRRWTADPGRNHPQDFLRAGSVEALPCWQTCWEPLRPGPKAQGRTSPTAQAALDAAAQQDARLAGGHCTPTCPSSAVGAMPALQWRQRWDAQLAAFLKANTEARELVELTGFIRPLPSSNFMWGVF